MSFVWVLVVGVVLGAFAKFVVWRKHNHWKLWFYLLLGMGGALWGAYLMVPVFRLVGWIGEGKSVTAALITVVSTIIAVLTLPFLLRNRKS